MDAPDHFPIAVLANRRVFPFRSEEGAPVQNTAAPITATLRWAYDPFAPVAPEIDGLLVTMLGIHPAGLHLSSVPGPLSGKSGPSIQWIQL